MFLDNQHTQEYYEIIKQNQTLTQNLSVTYRVQCTRLVDIRYTNLIS